MMKITKWNDISNLDEPLKTFVQNRFKYLYKTYCEDIYMTLYEFSLFEYGEIFLAEEYADIEGKLFEYVTKHIVSNQTFYLGIFVVNNSVATDYIIPMSILTAKQIEILEREI